MQALEDKYWDQLEALAQKQSGPDAVETLVAPLISGSKVPSDRQKQYVQRLSYGLRHYYMRRYYSSGSSETFEE